jgi:hypothetical protein
MHMPWWLLAVGFGPLQCSREFPSCSGRPDDPSNRPPVEFSDRAPLTGSATLRQPHHEGDGPEHGFPDHQKEPGQVRQEKLAPVDATFPLDCAQAGAKVEDRQADQYPSPKSHSSDNCHRLPPESSPGCTQQRAHPSGWHNGTRSTRLSRLEAGPANTARRRRGGGRVSVEKPLDGDVGVTTRTDRPRPTGLRHAVALTHAQTKHPITAPDEGHACLRRAGGNNR